MLGLGPATAATGAGAVIPAAAPVWEAETPALAVASSAHPATPASAGAAANAPSVCSKSRRVNSW
jgi:hypothetical protein